MLVMSAASEPLVNVARDGEITETILLTIAEKRGVDPTDIETLLYDVVDPDALDRIFRDLDGEWTRRHGSHLVLSMAGCHVLVRDTGHVVVTSERSTRDT